MIEIINLDKLSNDGYKQPANDPTSNTPDNITHAQLRYNTFTSSYVIQGVVVTGSSSSFEFTITGIAYTLFKLYVSTDGTNYTENKSYGGSTGRTINETSTNAVLITGNQTVAGVKTFSDIPIISTTATTSTQAVNKLFVDTRNGTKQWKGLISGSASDLSIVKTFVNTTGTTVTPAREGTGYFTMTFSAGWMGVTDNPKVSIEYNDINSFGSAIDRKIVITQYFEDPGADTIIEIYNYAMPGLTTIDSLPNTLLTITLYP